MGIRSQPMTTDYNWPFRTPASSSAAARCLSCSLSTRRFSNIGFRTSKGSSSRSWTKNINQDPQSWSTQMGVALHIDFTHDILSCVTTTWWFSSARWVDNFFQYDGFMTTSRTDATAASLGFSQGKKVDWVGWGRRYSSNSLLHASQPWGVLSHNILNIH